MSIHTYSISLSPYQSHSQAAVLKRVSYLGTHVQWILNISNAISGQKIISLSLAIERIAVYILLLVIAIILDCSNIFPALLYQKRTARTIWI